MIDIGMKLSAFSFLGKDLSVKIEKNWWAAHLRLEKFFLDPVDLQTQNFA